MGALFPGPLQAALQGLAAGAAGLDADPQAMLPVAPVALLGTGLGNRGPQALPLAGQHLTALHLDLHGLQGRVQSLAGLGHLLEGPLQVIAQLVPFGGQGLAPVVPMFQASTPTAEIGADLGQAPLGRRDPGLQGLAFALQGAMLLPTLLQGRHQGRDLSFQCEEFRLQGLERLAPGQDTAQGVVPGRGTQPVGTDQYPLRGHQGLAGGQPGSFRQGLVQGRRRVGGAEQALQGPGALDLIEERAPGMPPRDISLRYSGFPGRVCSFRPITPKAGFGGTRCRPAHSLRPCRVGLGRGELTFKPLTPQDGFGGTGC